jgi:hypothetical protein
VIQNSKLSALYVTAPQPKVSLKIIMKPKLVHTMIKHDSRMRQYSRVTSAFPEFIRPNGGGAVGSTAAIAEISRTRAALMHAAWRDETLQKFWGEYLVKTRIFFFFFFSSSSSEAGDDGAGLGSVTFWPST